MSNDTYRTLSAHPRYDSTVELDLADMLTTEAQDAFEREQAAWVAGWIADAITAEGRI